jgi:hypothetical protein
MKRSRLGEYALIAEPRKSFSSFVYAFGVAVNNLDDVVEPDDQCGEVATWRRGDVGCRSQTHFVRRWPTTAQMSEKIGSRSSIFLPAKGPLAYGRERVT